MHHDAQAEAQAKEMYGHVNTPPAVVERMLECLPAEYWAPDGEGRRWLDCGAGLGAIGGRVLERLPPVSGTRPARIDMIEVNPSAAAVLCARFGGDVRARVVEADFLALGAGAACPEYDVVVANPPYNVGGAIKTPTNTSVQKSLDGRVVWRDFVRRSLGLLKAGGHAVFLVPSCWLRGGEVYRLLLVENDGLSVECMSNTQTNRAFGQLAQTPTCIVHVRRRAQDPSPPEAQHALRMYDRASNSWVGVPRAHVEKGRPLPTDNARLVLKLARAAERGPTLAPLVTKTTLMKKRNRLTPPSPVATAATPHANVKTCVLARSASNRRRKKRPTVVLEYTAEPTKFQADGRPQLILAHKMYGLPLLDASGAYGVTNADSYVVRAPDDDIGGLARVQGLLCSPLALLVFESFRYRMRFLEREAFDVLPDPRHAAAAAAALESLDATDAAAVKAFARRLQFALNAPSLGPSASEADKADEADKTDASADSSGAGASNSRK